MGAARRRGVQIGPLTRCRHAIADRLVLSKVRDLFGPDLQLVLTGAAPISKTVLEFFDACGVTVLEGYGLSETTAAGTLNTPSSCRFGTVGRALPDVELSIAADGEILMRGPNVFRGYFKDDEATREVLDDGWLHSGDLATMNENDYCKITGRSKDLIIRGGENIYPRDIEEFLYTHPAISEVQVIGIPDRKYGEQVMAWVKLKPGVTASSEELREYCEGKIAYFKIPKYFKFTDSFPMTVTGKIQKFKMREMSTKELGLEQAASIRTA